MRAITLIETVVTLGVVSATIGMIAGFIKYHQPSITLNRAAGDVRATLNEARNLSLTSQTNHGVLFDVANESFYLMQNGNVLASTTLPTYVEFGLVGPFTNDTAIFNSAGAAAETGTVILQNTSGDTKSITINPSGFVTVQ